MYRYAATAAMATFHALLAVAGNACAQSYPNKAIRVVIGALPGDACDVLTRLIGARMAEPLASRWRSMTGRGRAARSVSPSLHGRPPMVIRWLAAKTIIGGRHPSGLTPD